MLKFEYTISDAMGLHARNAMSLCKIAESYEARIRAEVRERNVDCKNVMGLMGLQARCGDVISFCLEGADEEEAASGIKAALPTIL